MSPQVLLYERIGSVLPWETNTGGLPTNGSVGRSDPGE